MTTGNQAKLLFAHGTKVIVQTSKYVINNYNGIFLGTLLLLFPINVKSLTFTSTKNPDLIEKW